MRATGALWRRRVGVVIAAAAISCALSEARASSAAVAGVPLAQLPNVAQRLTAYDGYVVFSQLDSTGQWSLMVWRDGSTKPLPVPPRSIPFDAGAGSTATGKAAVVFSKCAKDPPAVPEESADKNPRPEWSRAIGCHIYELILPAGAPKLVTEIQTPGVSDSTPAIWGGKIAFARRSARSRAAKLFLWHPSSHSLVPLGGGPRSCPASEGHGGLELCRGHSGAPSAWVGDMSMDGHALSYEWFLYGGGPRIGALAFPEIRVDPLRAGRQSAPSLVAAATVIRGTCGGWEGRSPSVMGGSVLFTESLGNCAQGSEELSSKFVSYSVKTRKRQARPTGPGLAVAVAVDRGATYWIRDVLTEESTRCISADGVCAGSAFAEARNCSPPASVCTLMKTDDLERH
jgi:hypothetical protein